jgi:hypothetical protein
MKKEDKIDRKLGIKEGSARDMKRDARTKRSGKK